MTAMRISEVARRSGIPTTTLRYYEGVGLLPAPPRSGSGYRLYDERVLSRLALISRAKALGVRLDDMADLVRLVDGEQCEPVADRLRELVAEKRTEVAARLGELAELGLALDSVAWDLHAPTPGPCGDDCACLSAGPRRPLEVVPAELGAACSLDEADAAARLAAWSAVARAASSRTDIDGGVRLGLGDEVDLGEIANLAAVESACCPVFEFTITVDARGRAIEVRVPGEQAGAVRELLGAAS